MFSGCRKLAALLGLVALTSAADPARVFRVAADPNNLPFSNQRGEGFENRLADLLAAELNARLEYMWWPQRRGFFRETVGSGRADAVLGVPAGFERVLTTKPYYTSTYVFVQRAGRRRVTSFDDSALSQMRIGVQLAGDDGVNTPPAHALARRGFVENIRGYTLFGDYAQDSPPADIIKAVAVGDVDVAVAWGPMAGYFARRQTTPLVIVPVGPCECGQLRFVFSIAVGVARGKPELRDKIDEILKRRVADVTRLLDEFAIPRVEPASAQKGGMHDGAH